MKFKLHGTDKNEGEDSIIIEGDSIEELQVIAKIETEKRGWSNCWSEEIK